MTPPKTLGSVLFIDDDEIETTLFKRICGRSPVVQTCRVMNDPVDAYDHLLTCAPIPYDVIFVDLNMPKLRGIEMLRLLEAKAARKFKEVTIVMLTSSIDYDDRRIARKCGILTAYTSKPLDDALLMQLAEHYGTAQRQADCLPIS